MLTFICTVSGFGWGLVFWYVVLSAVRVVVFSAGWHYDPDLFAHHHAYLVLFSGMAGFALGLSGWLDKHMKGNVGLD